MMRFDLGFSIMSIIFPIFFIFVFGMMIFIFFKGISQWNYNNKQPVLSVAAKITSKRMNTTHDTNNMDNNFTTTSSTYYYVTFEVESGDRMELHVPSHEFGLLAEGDTGKLTFQGTRYLWFERDIINI